MPPQNVPPRHTGASSFPGRWSAVHGSRVLGGGWATILCAAALALPFYWWPLEAARNLAVYIAVAAFSAGLLLLWCAVNRGRAAGNPAYPDNSWGRRLHLLVLGAGNGVAALLLLTPALPFYFADAVPRERLFPTNPAPPAAVGTEFSWMLANVHSANGSYDGMRQVLDRVRPDLVGILECTPEWAKALDLGYPHTRFIARADNFGLALLSNFPLFGESQPAPFIDQPPVINVRFSLTGDFSVPLVLIHAQPPASNDALFSNHLLLRRVATELRHDSAGGLVMGDLNATPFSPFYRILAEGGDLSHVFWTRGLVKTWPAGIWPVRLTLDHLMYRGPFEVLEARVIDLPGSDHRGLFARMRVSAETVPASRAWEGK